MDLPVMLRWALLGLFESPQKVSHTLLRELPHTIQAMGRGISTSGTCQALGKGFMLPILVGATQRGKLGWGLLSHTDTFLVSHLSSAHIKNLTLMM